MRHAALVLLLLTVSSLAGCVLPDNKPRISIEFGAVPELEGATVLIDGKPAGKLERTGQATRIAFPVEKGKHEVSFRHPQFDCQPVTVNAELDAQKIRLMADVSEYAATTLTPPSGKPIVTFRY